ncbi:unnamed protein product [Rotaria sp. Silwood2]|nr:unnamed protein product [Rotaria sp. Silwood2]CAF2516023.1 unnamed protein product [Rotaria sp. Silwood2]CAF3877010.1 unnamed protein product [Rotaria sp. Silwood2]CAF4003104.1 unnamed protein product [Rotaria sp. Silwood2]
MYSSLPPRGGYQRELDEPGDENALLRHVVYITGLPKEIQNETLAEVFSAACGPIAPVDVRSPKPKIWVYKDRQTREGKGEATITFINPESCQMAINYFNELFGREIRVTLCPRRMYSMQKQNTPFNPAAPPMNTTTPISSMIKSISTNNNAVTTTTTTTTMPSSTSTTTVTVTSPSSTIPTTTTASSNVVTAANPIATISSSTLGLPRQLNHSLFKLRQTPEQQRGLLPTPPNSFGASIMTNALQRDGVRKELPRIVL